MIERHFVKGTTFSWAAPSPVSPPTMDGTIVQSGQSPGPGMTYQGLDTEIVYGPMPKPFSLIYAKTNSPASHGLTTGFSVPYVWLDYVLGRTAYQQPAAGSDVLTGFMSGCWICTWTQGGIRHVGHIGTVESAAKDAPPNSTVKTTFSTMITGIGAGAGLTGYNPALAWSYGDITSVCKEAGNNWGNLAGNAKVMSLATSANDFYSILMIRRSPNLWICGGKKKVNASNQAAVLNALQ